MPNPGYKGSDDPRFAGIDEAMEQAGGVAAHAARIMGVPPATFDKRLAALRAYREATPGQQESIDAARLDGLTATGGWIITDKDGEIIRRSTRWKADDPQNDPARLLEALKAGLADMPPAAVVPPPVYSDDDLMTLYLIADSHFGLMAWGRETGQDWDSAKASERMRDWIKRCVASSPPSARAVILDVGDTTHADNQTNQTPQSHHGLDVDTRFYKTMTTACEALRTATETALAKHDHVTVVILPGNHNRDSYVGLRLGLYYWFRDNPRVTVYHEPGKFWVEQFGNAMVAAHHGDAVKAERIVMFLADEHHSIWGQTKHRFLWTGHLHHHKSADIGGVQWEQLRAMTARDAYSVANAYSARAQLQAVTLHRTEGEVQRVKVNA